MIEDIKFELLSIPIVEVLRGYTSTLEVFNDVTWLNEEDFLIGDKNSNEVYTISEFRYRYSNEYYDWLAYLHLASPHVVR